MTDPIAPGSDARFTLRLSAQDLTALEMLRELDGRKTKSGAIRRLIRKELMRRRVVLSKLKKAQK